MRSFIFTALLLSTFSASASGIYTPTKKSDTARFKKCCDIIGGTWDNQAGGCATSNTNQSSSLENCINVEIRKPGGSRAPDLPEQALPTQTLKR